MEACDGRTAKLQRQRAVKRGPVARWITDDSFHRAGGRHGVNNNREGSGRVGRVQPYGTRRRMQPYGTRDTRVVK